ncbi:hypothetical protein Tco_0630599 [Tanacetum coccineum]
MSKSSSSVSSTRIGSGVSNYLSALSITIKRIDFELPNPFTESFNLNITGIASSMTAGSGGGVSRLLATMISSPCRHLEIPGLLIPLDKDVGRKIEP